MQECTTAPARAKKARAPVKPEPIEAVAPEPTQSPYDAIADMGRQIEEGFRMLVDDTLVSDSSPLDVTIDFIRRHIREALWNFASPDIHTVNDGPIAWYDQMTMALDPMPDVLNIVLVAARQSKSPLAIKVLENLKSLIEAMNLALTHWDKETLALAFREVTEDERPASLECEDTPEPPEPQDRAAPDQPAARADWRVAVVEMLEMAVAYLEEAADEMSGNTALAPCVYGAGTFAAYLAEDIRSAIGDDPDMFWDRILQRQSCRLDELCHLVEMLHGQAVGHRGRHGVKEIDVARAKAIAAKALFDAGLEVLPRELPQGVATAEPAQQPPTQAVSDPAADAPTEVRFKRMEAAIMQMDALSQECFSKIEAIARLALLALETPRGHREIDSIAHALEAIQGCASDGMNSINVEAEDFGLNYVDETERRRREAAHG